LLLLPQILAPTHPFVVSNLAVPLSPTVLWQPSDEVLQWISAWILTQCGQLHLPSGACSSSGSRQTRW